MPQSAPDDRPHSDLTRSILESAMRVQSVLGVGLLTYLRLFGKEVGLLLNFWACPPRGQDVEPRPVQGQARRSPTGLHVEGPARLTERCASIAARASGPGPGRYGAARRIAQLSQRNSAPRRARRTGFLAEETEAPGSAETGTSNQDGCFGSKWSR